MSKLNFGDQIWYSLLSKKQSMIMNSRFTHIMAWCICALEFAVIIHMHRNDNEAALDIRTLCEYFSTASQQHKNFFNAKEDWNTDDLSQPSVINFLTLAGYLEGGKQPTASQSFASFDGQKYEVLVDANRDGSLILPMAGNRFSVTGPPGLVVVYRVDQVLNRKVLTLAIGP